MRQRGAVHAHSRLIQRRATTSLLMLLLCFAASLGAASAAAAKVDVRPISEAERAAVQDAASYLSRGPDAIYAELSQASPFRKIAQKDALDEIEVRLGPPQGATWELQTVVPALRDKNAVFTVSYPSGLDDGVVLDMVQEGSAFRIENIRMLAQRSLKSRIFPPADSSHSDGDGGTASLEAATVATRPAAPMMLVLLAALLTGAAAWLTIENRNLARVALIGAVLLAGLGFAVAMARDSRFALVAPVVKVEVKSSEDPRFPRLAALLPLRRTMALGSGDLDAAFENVSAKGSARDVAKLWRAAFDLQQMKLDDASHALKRFDTPSDIPLVEILRARVAYAQANEVDAALAYERAVSLGPGRDALWWEAAQVLSTLGFEDRARRYIELVERIGTRDANVFYAQAILDASKKRDEDAETALRRAWNMRPATRASIVDESQLWSVIRRPEIAPMVNLTASDETVVASPVAATRAIVLPADAIARVSGDYLDVAIGQQQELSVPGGACLAPAGSQVVDARAWSLAEETKALRDLPQLIAASHNAGAFTQPAMRRRMERTATALANHNRWNELVTLTSGLSARAENVPADVMLLRDAALQRTGQFDAAKKLLAELATNKALQRRKQAATLEQIGEMLAALDLNDEAIRLLDRASSIRPNPTTDDRVRQLQMNQRLATKYATYSSGHFEVHYPEDVSQQEAVQIGKVLENELVRMSRWVPVSSSFKPVVVNVVWWEDFRTTYTGSDFILGFYQGKITVPLAGVGLSPDAVGILSHELCHAMVAQATNDQAPHWFQEGIARRMEMVPYQENAFMSGDPSKLVSVSLLDAVLRGSPDPVMVSNAYSQAATTVRYIEMTYGIAGLQRLMQAFRSGATTEEAVQQVAGVTMPMFDMKLRAWGKTAGSAFDNPKPVRYDQTIADDIRWTKTEAPATQTPAGPALSGGSIKFSGAKREKG